MCGGAESSSTPKAIQKAYNVENVNVQFSSSVPYKV